jgi:hypothetical protein
MRRDQPSGANLPTCSPESSATPAGNDVFEGGDDVVDGEGGRDDVFGGA